jgi:hypothetical protein
MNKEPAVVLPLAAALAAMLVVSCHVVPAPVLWSLSPDRELSTAAAFSLTVTGSDFQSNSAIVFNGAAKATVFVGAGELHCQIAPADLAAAASGASAQAVSVPVYVSTPSAGISGTLNFRIDVFPEFAAARKIADATRGYYDSIRPQLVFAGGGRLLAAWRDQERIYVSASDDAGASWTSPVLLNTAPVSSYRFSLAAGRTAGQLFLAWEESSRIYLIRSADGGRSWSARAALTDPSVSTAQNPGLFVDASGSLLAAYTSRSPAGGAPYTVIILKSTDGGATFAALGAIAWNTYFTGDRGPRMAADAAGLLYLVFPSDFGTRYMTDYLAFSTNGGVSWSTPVNVNLVGSALATDGLNGVLLAGSNMYLPYTYELTFKRSDDRGATWSSQDFADTTFTFPDLVVNAFGSTDLAWKNKFSRSFDRGSTWNQIVSFTDDATADYPALAEDASGRIFIVWWSTVGAIYVSSSLR